MEDAGEKSQDPTPHRRQQAREEGQVVHSQDLAAAALLTVGLLLLLTMSGPLVGFFEGFAHEQVDAWELERTGGVHVHHVTDDLAGFLTRLP